MISKGGHGVPGVGSSGIPSLPPLPISFEFPTFLVLPNRHLLVIRMAIPRRNVGLF